jgi:hypothetical protein
MIAEERKEARRSEVHSFLNADKRRARLKMDAVPLLKKYA